MEECLLYLCHLDVCVRPLLESSESATSQPTYGERATKLLHGLETHSVLFVLHRSTQLAALDSQEVLRLLQNVARGSGGIKIRLLWCFVCITVDALANVDVYKANGINA